MSITFKPSGSYKPGTNPIQRLGDVQTLLKGAGERIKQKDGTGANEYLEEAKKLLKGGTSADTKQLNSFSNLQDAIRSGLISGSASAATVNSLLDALNRNNKNVTDRRNRLASAENANLNLVSTLGSKAQSILASLNGARFIASAGRSDTSSSGKKYSFGEIQALQGKDDALNLFKSTGYNWKKYIGDDSNFNLFFEDLQKKYDSINKKENRKSIGKDDDFAEALNQAGAHGGSDWRDILLNTALTVPAVLEIGSGQKVKYGYNKKYPVSPLIQWNCSTSCEFLINFSVNSKLYNENPSILGGKTPYEATKAQDLYGLILNPSQIVKQYPQIKDPRQIKPGDTLYTEIGDNGHTLLVLKNDNAYELIYTYDVEWGLSTVRHDQIYTKDYGLFSHAKKSSNISGTTFIATDMEPYAQELETITRWCSSSDVEFEAGAKAMKKVIKIDNTNGYGSTLPTCKKIIEAMGSDESTVTITPKGNFKINDTVIK